VSLVFWEYLLNDEGGADNPTLLPQLEAWLRLYAFRCAIRSNVHHMISLKHLLQMRDAH
jgi:hypothetical protein